MFKSVFLKDHLAAGMKMDLIGIRVEKGNQLRI